MPLAVAKLAKYHLRFDCLRGIWINEPHLKIWMRVSGFLYVKLSRYFLPHQSE